ncbi:MAG: hypothetical protein H6900_16610 [Rhodobacter sp.]|nr:hypothetical protein [Paracoccaceae bacterium]MCC0074901.1 hypothetical protein [Rhodobacter sp.]HPD91231.1 hypothetical protein [Pararhodobacter sp.]
MSPLHRKNRTMGRGARCPRPFGVFSLLLALALSVGPARADARGDARVGLAACLEAPTDTASARATFAALGWTESVERARIADAIAIALPLQTDLPAEQVVDRADTLYRDALGLAAEIAGGAVVFRAQSGAEVAVQIDAFGPGVSVLCHIAAPPGSDPTGFVDALPGDRVTEITGALAFHVARPQGGEGVMVNTATVIVPDQPRYDAVNPDRPDIPAILITSVLVRK